MSRELRRVPLNFDWPLRKVWHGYIHPKPKLSRRAPRKCSDCDGTGLNRHTKRISDDFYDFGQNGRRWCNAITQDEVRALVDKGRLWDFTRAWTPGVGWVDKSPPVVPTAADVNAWNARGVGHDAINRWILIERRARRLGVFDHCRRCRGEGTIWRRHTDKKRWCRWREFGPPRGDGWQVWETVSEGSPVSPVFATQAALVNWLCAPKPILERYSEQGVSRQAAEAFIYGSGWAPSAISNGTMFVQNIESLALSEASP